MPLTINVGLSRKSSHNYASQGVSLNLTAEMDHALLAHPARLQQEIAALYRHVEAGLARQESARGSRPGRDAERAGDRSGDRPSVRAGDRAGDRHSSGPAAEPFNPPATASQIRALRGLCKRLDTDLDQAAEDELGVPADQLDIRQASRLIDALKLRGTGARTERGS